MTQASRRKVWRPERWPQNQRALYTETLRACSEVCSYVAAVLCTCSERYTPQPDMPAQSYAHTQQPAHRGAICVQAQCTNFLSAIRPDTTCPPIAMLLSSGDATHLSWALYALSSCAAAMLCTCPVGATHPTATCPPGAMLLRSKTIHAQVLLPAQSYGRA